VSGFLGGLFSGDEGGGSSSKARRRGGGGGGEDSTDDASYERGGIEFPSAAALRDELMKDEEVRSKEQWVREMILDNVGEVFGGKVLTRRTCERRIARRVERLKAQPDNRDLYLDQPFLVRVAIDAAIPSVSEIVLEKVIAVAEGMPPPRSDLRDNERVVSKMDSVIDEVKRLVDRKLAPQCERDVGNEGPRVNVVVDWDSFEDAPSWFVAADFLSKREGADSFALITEAFRSACGRVPQRDGGRSGRGNGNSNNNYNSNGNNRNSNGNGRARADAAPQCGFGDLIIRYDPALKGIRQRFVPAADQRRGRKDSEPRLVIEGPFGASGHDATLRGHLAAIEHAVIANSVSFPSPLACNALADAADGKMPQTRWMATNAEYIRWLVAGPAFWAPFHDIHASALADFRRTVDSGSRDGAVTVKAWSALLVDPRTDYENECYVAVSPRALFIKSLGGGGSASVEEHLLSTLHVIQWGGFDAAGGGCCSAPAQRRKAAEGAHGVRLRFDAATVTLRALPHLQAAALAKQELAERAHADEMALCVLAVSGGENNDKIAYERAPVSLTRSAPAFSSAGGHNFDRRGVVTR
jgi:hypothetical protein